MRLTIAAASLAIAALVAAAPASAEMVGGGPIKQNGQCWKSSKATDGGSYGTWGACAQSASTPAKTHRRGHS